jgi:hypothetical protein
LIACTAVGTSAKPVIMMTGRFDDIRFSARNTARPLICGNMTSSSTTSGTTRSYCSRPSSPVEAT